MKIIKKNEHSLLVRVLGIKSKLYITTSILLYFDLENPNMLLKEQDLWTDVPKQLGKDIILDVGMPKPKGEFLVHGSCFAPRGTRRPASEVLVKVGKIQKKLNVFGNRYWNSQAGILQNISEPEAFEQMPITWQNAFGGKEFVNNPNGKGMDPFLTEKQTKVIPLPNIEYPDQLIGGFKDRPEPASFDPYHFMAPQRMTKQGTYDEKWLKERWPYFPDDMNYEYFNTTSSDQINDDGAFIPRDDIEIINMHPDKQAIYSNLPDYRTRCFVTKKKSLNLNNKEEEFCEVTTKIDTVWLFPSILRGVVIYRGSTEIIDDEYLDVKWVYVATEKQNTEPKTIDYYFDAQKKELDRRVPADFTLGPEFNKKMSKGMRDVGNIPKKLKKATLKASGKAPVEPVSKEERIVAAKAKVDAGVAKFDSMEQKFKTAKFGKNVDDEILKIQAAKKNLLNSKNDFDKLLQKLQQGDQDIKKAKAKLAEVKKQEAKKIKAKVPKDYLKKAGVEADVDKLLEDEDTEQVSQNLWHDKGFSFVVECKKKLRSDFKTKKILYDLGFEDETIEDAWLGINTEERRCEIQDWGLTDKNKDNDEDNDNNSEDEPKPLIIPAGLVIPKFKEADLVSIFVRKKDFENKDKDKNKDNDVVVKGSDKKTNIYLESSFNNPLTVVCVSTMLEAYLIEQVVGDLCGVVVSQKPDDKLDKETKTIIKNAPCLLIIQSAQESENKDIIKSWEKAYPNTKAAILPTEPKQVNHVFEAHKKDFDLRSFIISYIPEKSIKDADVEQKVIEGKTLLIPSIDADKLADKMKKDITAHVKLKTDKISKQPFDRDAKLKEVLNDDNVKKALAAAGKTPDDILAQPIEQAPKKSISQIGADVAAVVYQQRDDLKAKGLLKPDAEADMNKKASAFIKQYQDIDAKISKVKAKTSTIKSDVLAKVKKANVGKMPEAAKIKLKKAGIDPDKMIKYTREQVIEKYNKKESLAFAILDKVDLSNLDLTGIDLANAKCKKTKFCKTNLTNANFYQANATESDCTEAILIKANLEKANFSKSKFIKADLSQINSYMGNMKEADLTGANLSEAKFEMFNLNKTKLIKTNFSFALLKMGFLSKADATGANFSGAKLEKCMIKETLLDNANFSKSTLNSTMFSKASGKNVTFFGANLNKGRMSANCCFPEADFQNIIMTHGCFMNSDLHKAVFTGSKLTESIIENCNLTQVNFFKVSLKKCRFNKSNLEGANLKGANLFQGSLRKARIVNTDFSYSNLFAVDFYKATVGETNFDQANLKMTQLYQKTDALK